MPTENELLSQISTLHEKVRGIWDAADSRKAADGDESLTTTEYQTVIETNKEIERLESEVAAKRDQRAAEQAARAAFAARENDRKAVNAHGPGAMAPQAAASATRPERMQSAADMLLAHEGFKAWRDGIQMGGGISSAKFGSSPRVNLPYGVKALLAGSDVAGTEFYGLPGGYAERPLTIRQIVTTGNTATNAIDYVIEGSFVNNAAPVADATASSGITGAKPESDLDYTPATTTVRTIAHFVAVPRSVLADSGQLRMYTDQFLRYGVEEELEDQMLTGSGSGNNLTGIRNVSGIQSQTFSTDIITTIRKGRTKAEVTGRVRPSAIVMHPNDWESVDLAKDAENRYYYGGPSILGTPRLWGLPVVLSQGMTSGYAVVGDWRRAVLLDREMAQVFMSDSHSDFFVRNLVALLAELRAAFFVTRPTAFVDCALS